MCVTLPGGAENALAGSGFSPEYGRPMARILENEAFTSATTEAGQTPPRFVVVVDFLKFKTPAFFSMAVVFDF